MKSFTTRCILLLLVTTVRMHAQTTIIDPAGAGGFELGTTFSSNGWTATSGSANSNQWVCHTGATSGFFGSRCAYVSRNSAAIVPPHTYAMVFSTTAAHIYRNISIPSGETDIDLQFSMISRGETADRMKVWLVPSNYSPSYGTAITATGTAPSGRILIASYFNQTSWTNQTYALPASYAGTTSRLVIEWVNDDSGGANPPGAIDNILLTSISDAPNNLCPNALTISPSTGTTSYSGNTTNATASNPPLSGSCGTGNTTAADVWYRFTPSASGTLTLHLGASYDSQLSVYSGACPGSSTACLAGDDDGGNPIGDSNDPGPIVLSVNAATNYYIRVFGYNTDAGAYTLQAIHELVLPLELASFTGNVQTESNMLAWETFSEKNVQWHIVERSTDGLQWKEIGRSPGQADSQSARAYTLEDRTPPARAYYRLRSVDFDGTEHLSKSIALTRRRDNLEILAAFPSPATDFTTIQFFTPLEEDVHIRLLDFSGKVLLEQVYAAEKGINDVSVPLNNLQAGTYLLSLFDVASTATPLRIVKE